MLNVMIILYKYTLKMIMVQAHFKIWYMRSLLIVETKRILNKLSFTNESTLQKVCFIYLKNKVFNFKKSYIQTQQKFIVYMK